MLGSLGDVWRGVMIEWALIFLVFAIIAAFLGFGGIYDISIKIAVVLFIVFLVLIIISAFRRRPRHRIYHRRSY